MSNDADLLVNVLRMAGHAHLCDAAARQRALASAGRASDIEDDDLIAEWLRSSHAECVQLGEAVISVSKRWRDAVLRNHSDASWLPEEWVAMKIKRLPLRPSCSKGTGTTWCTAWFGTCSWTGK